jgi:transporter family-2 protein
MRSGLVVGAAILCGVAVAFQAQFNGVMQRQMGTLESSFVTYFSGGMVIGLIMLIARGGRLAAGSGLPWYVYTAGLLGLVFIAGMSFLVGEIGLVPGLVLITLCQFVAGAIISHFGLLGAVVVPIDLAKIAGFALLGVGTFLVLR